MLLYYQKQYVTWQKKLRQMAVIWSCGLILGMKNRRLKPQSAVQHSRSLSFISEEYFPLFHPIKTLPPFLILFCIPSVYTFSACSMCTMYASFTWGYSYTKKIYLPDTFYSWNGLFCHPKNVYSWVQHIEQRLYSYTQFGIEILCCCFGAIKSKKIMSRADYTIL